MSTVYDAKYGQLCTFVGSNYAHCVGSNYAHCVGSNYANCVNSNFADCVGSNYAHCMGSNYADCVRYRTNSCSNGISGAQQRYRQSVACTSYTLLPWAVTASHSTAASLP